MPDFSVRLSHLELESNVGESDLGENEESLPLETEEVEPSFPWLRFAYWLVACGLASVALVLSLQRGPAFWHGLLARAHALSPFLSP